MIPSGSFLSLEICIFSLSLFVSPVQDLPILLTFSKNQFKKLIFSIGFLFSSLWFLLLFLLVPPSCLLWVYLAIVFLGL